MAKTIEWIKITTGMFEDEKIEFIETLPEGDSIFKIWVRLLCMAGRCNAGGYIFITEKIPYTEDALVAKFKKSLTVVRLALETLRKLDMIQTDENGFIAVTNWAKHQNVDGMDKIREQTRLRTAAYRERLKLTSSDANREQSNAACDVTGDATVTQSSISYSTSDSSSLNSSEENSISKEIQEDIVESNQKRPFIPAGNGSSLIDEIIKYWNSKGLVRCVFTSLNLRSDDRTAFLNTLSAYGIDAVKQAIDNYAAVISNPAVYNYEPKYQYRSIGGFMAKGVVFFSSDNNPLERYARNKKSTEYENRTVPERSAEEDAAIQERLRRKMEGVI